MPSHPAEHFIRRNQVLKFSPAVVLLGSIKRQTNKQAKNAFCCLMEISGSSWPIPWPTNSAGGEGGASQRAEREKKVSAENKCLFSWQHVSPPEEQNLKERHLSLSGKVKSSFSLDQLLLPTPCG